MRRYDEMYPNSHSSRAAAVVAPIEEGNEASSASTNDDPHVTSQIRGRGIGESSSSSQKIGSTATNTSSATSAVPQSTNVRRSTADKAIFNSDVRPVLLRSPVQPWSPQPSVNAVNVPTNDNRYIRPVTLDPSQRTSSFNDAPTNIPSGVQQIPLSPSSAAGKRQASGMLATSRVAPYHYPTHLAMAASSQHMHASASSSAPTASSMQPGHPNPIDLHQGMTSVSPTRTTFIERHSHNVKDRQRTLSDMHPSNFAALHTALAKAVIAAGGEDDKGSHSNRKRTQSCDVCRIRKVKCVRPDDENGSNPSARCKQCELNDAKCTYAYVLKKPGPHSSSTGSGSSSAAAKQHARWISEERQQASAGIVQQRTMSAQDLAQQQGSSFFQQLSPIHPNDAQWTSSSYVHQQPLFSPASVRTASDTGSNPFESHFVGVGAGVPLTGLEGFTTTSTSSQHVPQEHERSSYATSSVSASPSVSTFAHAPQHPSGMSSSSPRPGVADHGVPSSPLAAGSFAMTASVSAPRPAQQHSSASSSQSYSSSPLVMNASASQAGPGAASGHFMPPSYPLHPHPFADPNTVSQFSPSSALLNIGTANGPAGYPMPPLHSAPPTMTHFDAEALHAGPPNMQAMGMATAGHYHPQQHEMLLSQRNASFSHGLPTIPQYYPTPFPNHANENVDWQQQQYQQADDQFRRPYPNDQQTHEGNNNGGPW